MVGPELLFGALIECSRLGPRKAWPSDLLAWGCARPRVSDGEQVRAAQSAPDVLRRIGASTPFRDPDMVGGHKLSLSEAREVVQ
jgi:hypothetical protein